MSAKPLEQVPFVNQLGHEIEPGDNVLVVTTCTGITYIKTGKYLGKRSSSYNKNRISVSVELEEVHKVYVHRVTGERWTGKVDVEYPQIPQEYYQNRYDRVLSNDDREKFKKMIDEYDVKYAAYQDAIAKARKDYHYVDVPSKRKTSLQLNRIFPLSMKVRDLAGQRF